MNSSKVKTTSFKKFSILIAFWSIFPMLSPAQSAIESAGRLPTNNYVPEEYKGHRQVWDVVEGEHGLMYFAHTNGLQEYDGVSWRSVFGPLGIKDFCRNLAKSPDGKIFYSGNEKIGYLKPNAFGEMEGVSLYEMIPEEFLPIGQFNTFQFKGPYTYLQTRNYVFQFEFTEDFSVKSLKTWKAETQFTYSFLQNGILYFPQMDKGLYVLKEGEMSFIQGTEELGNGRFQLMLPYPEDQNGQKRYLVASAFSDLFLFDGQRLTKFSSELDSFLKDNAPIYKGLVLSDGNFLIALLGYGAVILDTDGKVLRWINSDNGLLADEVSSFYLDRIGGLWIATLEGISRVEINSSGLIYGKDAGVPSVVTTIQKIGEDLYLGTNNGLLKFDSEDKKFKPFSNILNKQIFEILEDGDDIIVPSIDLHVVRNGRIFTIKKPSNGGAIYGALIPKNNPNILYVSTDAGVSLYTRGLSSEVPWEYLGEIEGIPNDSNILVEDGEGKIWSGSSTGSVFQISTQESGLSPIDLKNYRVSSTKVDGFTNSMISVKGEIYMRSESGLLKYSRAEGKFIPNTDFLIEPNKPIGGLFEDVKGRVWIVPFEGGKEKIAIPNSDGGFDIQDAPEVGLFTSFLGSYYGQDGINYLRLEKGIVRFDESKASDEELVFSLLLRRVETKTDTLEIMTYGLDPNTPSRTSLENSYRFEFAAPFFKNEKLTQYQTFLQGFDEDWVDWNNNKFKEYTNLPSGKYIFRVRAKNIYGLISQEATYSFEVLPPWYATWWAYVMYVLILALIIYRIVKFQSERLVAKERERAREKELAQAKEIEKAYHELKATQAQLIQSEKMASLGELTAGIAHEIQNPLNFVNNFSELNRDLIDEIEEERAKNQDSRDENLISEILKDIRENESKINHHGKRADAIVKGMLEHSKSGSGEKELTNLNTLAKEYLNLAYQGFKAKNKDGEIQLITDFDSSLPKIKIIRSDIGKVLLNIVNNAFYATNEPSKGLKPLEGFKPFVTVSTKNLGDKIQISISDNGPGIPEAIRDKIFQPFFTTKPTGQGTGLGLSLSYDIVKAHGGEISVESEKARPDDPVGRGIGTTFTITLPI